MIKFETLLTAFNSILAEEHVLNVAWNLPYTLYKVEDNYASCTSCTDNIFGTLNIFETIM